MAHILPDTDDRPEAGTTVSKAFVRAARRLASPSDIVSSLLKLSAEDTRRLQERALILSPETPQFNRALLFIRFYRSLDSICGGDVELMKKWLRGYNRALRARPLNLLSDPHGLNDVIAYLDSRRAPL